MSQKIGQIFQAFQKEYVKLLKIMLLYAKKPARPQNMPIQYRGWHLQKTGRRLNILLRAE